MIRVASKDNPSVRRLRALTEKKKERRASGLFVCEGEKVFREAVAAGVQISDVLLTDQAAERLSGEIAACGREVTLMLEIKPDNHDKYKNMPLREYYAEAAKCVKRFAAMVEAARESNA